MKLAVLFSGGKDSNYALYEASKKHEIACLISMISDNKESYMFQTPGNDFLDMQADSLNIPLLKIPTKGKKEEELKDLKLAIQIAKEKFGIEGVVTGAIKSAYQSSRIQKICYELEIWCFNPLWQIDEHQFLQKLIKSKFEVMIIGVFAYPLTQKYIGKILDEKILEELFEIEKKYSISPAGEGGELESFVLNGPLHKKRLNIKGTPKMDSENSGIMQIEEVNLE